MVKLNTILYIAATDECKNNPCQNNGSCKDVVGPGVNCTCEQGWTGTYCETGMYCITYQL